MKLTKTAGKTTLSISRKEWERIGGTNYWRPEQAVQDRGESETAVSRLREQVESLLPALSQMAEFAVEASRSGKYREELADTIGFWNEKVREMKGKVQFMPKPASPPPRDGSQA